MAPPRRWTREARQSVYRLLDSGKTVEEVAKMAGITPETLEHALRWNERIDRLERQRQSPAYDALRERFERATPAPPRARAG